MFQTIRAFEELYGRRAADLYDQAAQQNEKARAQYNKAMDTYFQANQAADYDAHKQAQDEWQHFYNIPSDSSSVWDHLQ